MSWKLCQKDLLIAQESPFFLTSSAVRLKNGLIPETAQKSDYSGFLQVPQNIPGGNSWSECASCSHQLLTACALQKWGSLSSTSLCAHAILLAGIWCQHSVGSLWELLRTPFCTSCPKPEISINWVKCMVPEAGLSSKAQTTKPGTFQRYLEHS